MEHLAIGQSEAILEGRAESEGFLDLLKTHIRELSFVEKNEDSVRVIHSQVIAKPKNPRMYKVWVKFQEWGN